MKKRGRKKGEDRGCETQEDGKKDLKRERNGVEKESRENKTERQRKSGG